MIDRVNTYSLLSLQKRYNIVQDVIKYYRKGMKQQDISKTLDVSESFITLVLKANNIKEERR